MAFKTLDQERWKKMFRRSMIIGLPNSWKTTSIYRDSDGKPDNAWPRPIHLLSYPGENGAASIDVGQEGLHPYIWEEEEAKSNPVSTWAEVQRETINILTGKYGPCTTFAGDGLHKLYALIFEAKFSELVATYGDKIDEDKLRGRAFGLSHEAFLKYVGRVSASTIPYAVFTAWTGKDKDEPDNPQSRASHIWPDLPGELAKRVMGEFGSVLFAEPGQEVGPGKYTKGTWQTRKFGKVWGCGIKAPANIISRVPTVIPQDWKKLEALVLGPTPVPAQANPKPASK